MSRERWCSCPHLRTRQPTEIGPIASEKVPHFHRGKTTHVSLSARVWRPTFGGHGRRRSTAGCWPQLRAHTEIEVGACLKCSRREGTRSPAPASAVHCFLDLLAPSRGCGGDGERPASGAAATPEAKPSRRHIDTLWVNPSAAFRGHGTGTHTGASRSARGPVVCAATAHFARECGRRVGLRSLATVGKNLRK